MRRRRRQCGHAPALHLSASTHHDFVQPRSFLVVALRRCAALRRRTIRGVCLRVGVVLAMSWHRIPLFLCVLLLMVLKLVMLCSRGLRLLGPLIDLCVIIFACRPRALAGRGHGR